uniref:Uncharacterized protein n=1 Tax=Globisporangium ultimum (strain ATCC 200006 / CBS 805.95 / DAOM BR144) TaxID=431595 RepID=K3WS13_GLOUD
MVIDSDAYIAYTNTYNHIDSTIDVIFDLCGQLGYNVTHDSLRIVDGANSVTMKLLPGTLPVLVMPFSDNSYYSQYAIPGWDGSACLFRLNGAYETKGWPEMTMRGLNRSVLEQRTVELLGRTGGVWRNGWYEDQVDMKWFTEFMSSHRTSLGIQMREFNMLTNIERDCSDSSGCGQIARK